MPKSKHRHRHQGPPIRDNRIPPMPPPHHAGMLVPLGYDPKGPSESVDIVSSKDGWSEYNLADGTVIRAKAALLDVKKMTGQYSADGEPVYVMQLTMVNQAKVPEELKKMPAELKKAKA